MPKSLLVVESPAKARTLSKYLGSDFQVSATVGHIKDLPQNQIGVNVEKGFQPSYRLIRGKSKVVERLRQAADGVDAIYLASDPDREGEAIAWHVAQEIAKGKSKEELPKFYRVLLHEITRSGVKRALDAAGKLDKRRYESQLARRILDRLVGYELSPLLWRKVSGGLSAGRVQSVAVALVVDREREIQGFDAHEYWVIRAQLSSTEPPEFSARLVRIGDDKAEVGSEEQAKPLLDQLRKAKYHITKVVREEKKRYALPPYITSTLQQDAHRLYRFSAKKTMSIAQRLYEGVDMAGDGTHGLITYMRTDSLRVSNDAIGAARGFVESNYGKQYLPSKPNFYKNKKSAQDAHEAIRPTSTNFPPDKVKQFVDRDSFRLYRLIWNRFLASQMVPARYDVTVATIMADDKWTFEATGRVLLFDGFLKVFKAEAQENGDEPPLPPLEKGKDLNLLSVDGEQNFTQPPPRFTEGTLVKELEKQGIGRPSTYATILSTVQEKNYVFKEKARFKPSELGYVVTDLLRENFPNVMNAKFTAKMEEALDRIEEGDAVRQDILKPFWEKFALSLETAKTDMRNVKQQPQTTELKCTRCESNMVIRFGKNGAFLACSAFPDCRTTLAFFRDDRGVPVVVEEQVAEEKCENCKGDMVLKDGRYGRFWACSDYPKCKTTRPFSTGLACPKDGCEGTLVEKKSKKRATFYRCSASPTCEFVLFGRPKETECSSCGNAYMEEKGRGKQKTLRCPKCGHTER